VQDLLQEALHRDCASGLGEEALDVSPGLSAQTGTARPIGEEAPKGLGQAGDVPRFDEQTIHAGNDRLRRCPESIGDDRPAAGHCLEHRAAGAVVAFGQEHFDVQGPVRRAQLVSAAVARE